MVGLSPAGLWAAADVADQQMSSFMVVVSVIAVLFGVFVLPFIVGSRIAKALRMKDIGGRVGVILSVLIATLGILAFGWPPKLGIDLKGGVILVYEVDVQSRTAAQGAGTQAKGDQTGGTNTAGDPNAAPTGSGFDMPSLIVALTRRINPGGTKEIVIRPFGERQVEIIIPDVDPLEIERIKKTISTAGMLEFRIVANGRDHAALFELARSQADDPTQRRLPTVKDANGKPLGFGPEWPAMKCRRKAVRSCSRSGYGAISCATLGPGKSSSFATKRCFGRSTTVLLDSSPIWRDRRSRTSMS
jgi:SecD/SecF fusion protein